MTKPYSLRELSARIDALIRRSAKANGNPSQVERDFYIERSQRLIHAKEQSVILSKKEFELFLLFYDHPGVLFPKEAILQEVWAGDEAAPHTVTVHIARLRKKIAFAEEWVGRIESAYGGGYRLVSPGTRRNAK